MLRLASEVLSMTNDTLPVSNDLFAKICRAAPKEARDLAMGLPSPSRARLALFCNARAHLREVGREIAGTCSQASLVLEGGQAGLVLFDQVKAGPETWGVPPRHNTRRVSLAG